MSFSVIGPKRPTKAFADLTVDSKRANHSEGYLENIAHLLSTFNGTGSYSNGINNTIYNYLWQTTFRSLTGEHLRDCVTLWVLPQGEFAPKIREVFGSEQAFELSTGYSLSEIQGINLDGTWIIYKEKNNVAMLADVYHEIGHRIYPRSANRYHHELGAHYFMLLALKKTSTELARLGLLIPQIDFGRQITDDHSRALDDAQRLVTDDIEYIHKVS